MIVPIRIVFSSLSFRCYHTLKAYFFKNSTEPNLKAIEEALELHPTFEKYIIEKNTPSSFKYLHIFKYFKKLLKDRKAYLLSNKV